jgi:isoquinoline 1-oxidoreductase beta subunit
MDFLIRPELDSRRDFIKKAAGITGGFVIGFHMPFGFTKAFGAETGNMQGKTKYPPRAFIQIKPDNSITLIINKLEMGQGVYTSMAQLIAEELECDWNKIQSQSAPVDAVYNNEAMGMQLTGGSTALNSTYDQYRKIGAMMRIMLVQAAADQWKVPATECHAENGWVIHPSKGKVSYGDVAELANKLPYPTEVTLKKSGDFKLIGKSIPRIDAHDKSTGKAIYGIDVKIPGMLYAVIARPPVVGGTIDSFDDKAAKQVVGVKDVVRFGDSIAVLGSNTWAAWKGRDALVIKWNFHGKDQGSDELIMADFKKLVTTAGAPVEKRGDADAAISRATHKLVAEYEFPYLAHAAMEPLNVTINYDGHKAELWSGHQSPTWDRAVAAKILELPVEKVELHTVYAGGSFGRRANKVSDYTVEAANLAKVVKKPLKVQWTREDDMKGGYYRPMNFHHVELGFDASNHLTGWKHKVIGQSVVGGSALEAWLVKDGVEGTVVEGVQGTAYDLTNFSVDLQRPTPNVTTLWWRSVGSTHTAYVMETLIDEAAHQAKQDPLAFRRKLLHKSPRHVAVLDLLQKHSGWGHKKPPQGRAWGLAIHESFKSVVGHIAEVSVSKDGDIQVHKVISAVHCGQVVNPEGAKGQVEGAIVYGLSAALAGEIKMDKGQIVTANFDTYPVLRSDKMPVVEVYFVPSNDTPTGLGEPGLPPIAPAVANALFQLTGKRIRKLPFSKGMA